MTFAELKDEIINRVRIFEICPNWQRLATATSQTDLIAAAFDRFEWSYDIIGDSLLAEFDSAILQAAGIYTGSNTVENPSLPKIYFFGDGSSALSITGSNKTDVTVMGTHSLTLQLSGFGFAELKSWGNTTVSITINDNASLCSEAVQDSTQFITNNNVAEIKVSDTGFIQYAGTGSSHAIIRAYNFSSLTPVAGGSATVDVRTFGNHVTINNPDT